MHISTGPMPPFRKLIVEYECDPQKVEIAIKNLSKKQLDWKPERKEWSINQIIVHLADTEMIFCQRMRKIIAEERPLLQSFDQDQWANRLFYKKQDSHYALELLIAQRKSTAELVRILPFSYWKREGIRDGKVFTVYDVFVTALQHIPTHLQQIHSIKHDLRFPPR